jgi:sortase A
MAFGPGHIDGTAPPNGNGNSALAGHRDSWFAFLEHLRVDDEIRLETRTERRCYRVDELAVRAEWESEVLAAVAERRLTLITCYPFGGLGRGDRRYVVICRERACAEPER